MESIGSTPKIVKSNSYVPIIPGSFSGGVFSERALLRGGKWAQNTA
ncbi:MAG: hypothetical protein IKH41_01745 [Clostridia bacterium]|nr:hypothetical protein [Clostridia bacterium]